MTRLTVWIVEHVAADDKVRDRLLRALEEVEQDGRVLRGSVVEGNAIGSRGSSVQVIESEALSCC